MLRKAKTTLLTARGGGGASPAMPSSSSAPSLPTVRVSVDDSRSHRVASSAAPASPLQRAPQLLPLGLPHTLAASPSTVLAASSRRVTASRATASRERLAACLQEYGQRRGDLDVAEALREYVPLAAACCGIADGLRRRGKPMPQDPFVWKGVMRCSGERAAGVPTEVRGGFRVEVVFVLFTDALVKVHAALRGEGRTMLDGTDEAELIAASKDLQTAAAQFRYVATHALPAALETVAELPPPPEMDVNVNIALADLSLALAQCLVARSAELSASFPLAALVKLTLGARQLCARALDSAARCAGVLTPAVANTARDLSHYVRAWAQRLLAAEAHAGGRDGEKAGRMRLAVQLMSEIADGGGVVGLLAAEMYDRDAKLFRQYVEDARISIEPEPDVSMMSLSDLETKVIVQEGVYTPPVAKTVKRPD